MSTQGTVDDAVAAIARGEFVVVVNGTDWDSEGDLVMAASLVEPHTMAFLVRHCSGLASVALRGDRLDALRIPMMLHDGSGSKTAAVSVDLAEGITTGISATDRAATVRALADPATRPEDFTRPGHVLPLRSKLAGLLERPGRAEAAADLAGLAGLHPAGLLCELILPDGAVARRAELESFADEHRLAIVTIGQLVAHRKRSDDEVVQLSTASVDTSYGPATVSTFREKHSGIEHVSVEYGSIDERTPVLVRIHSECLTGDVFGSQRCDCGPQLQLAQQLITERGSGVIVYLRGHEGRGIGLTQKLRAYNLQDGGLDTVDANLELGLPADARDYGASTAILRQLGVKRVRLLTNNPAKTSALEEAGFEISERVPLLTEANARNHAYLQTKKSRMGHLLTI